MGHLTILFGIIKYRVIGYKIMKLKDLNQITIIGLGLLGTSIALAIKRNFSHLAVVGYSHRDITRQKARKMAMSIDIAETIEQSINSASLVILASPICTFETIFKDIAASLPADCIVTDVGSTKTTVSQWAKKHLPQSVSYVGSHPIAGSEQRGLEFARDDLLNGAQCILTPTSGNKKQKAAANLLRDLWEGLGCIVSEMTPGRHDKIFASVSHLPHITAAAMTNATISKDLEFAGKGFVDTSRIASGPANIWTDVLSTNSQNCVKGIDIIIAELTKFKKAIADGNLKQINTLLEKARAKRIKMINHKMQNKEIL